jgi:hypothetical protein
MAFMRFKPLEKSMTIENNETTQPEETSPETTAPETGAPENIEGTQEQDTEHKPKQNGFQKRIDKLTREKYELQGRLKAMAERAPQRQVEERQEPEDQDSQDPQEMIRREVERRVQQEVQRQEAARRQSEVARTWKQQEAEARKRFEDYDEVVPEFVDSGRIPRHVEAALLECEKPVDVTYYLATHPEEADSIAMMSPFRAAATIGKIEARLAQAPALKKQSAAPEPIAPVKPKGKPDEGLSDELSAEDWQKRWHAKKRNKMTSQEWKRA